MHIKQRLASFSKFLLPAIGGAFLSLSGCGGGGGGGVGGTPNPNNGQDPKLSPTYSGNNTVSPIFYQALDVENNTYWNHYTQGLWDASCAAAQDIGFKNMRIPTYQSDVMSSLSNTQMYYHDAQSYGLTPETILIPISATDITPAFMMSFTANFPYLTGIVDEPNLNGVSDADMAQILTTAVAAKSADSTGRFQLGACYNSTSQGGGYIPPDPTQATANTFGLLGGALSGIDYASEDVYGQGNNEIASDQQRASTLPPLLQKFIYNASAGKPIEVGETGVNSDASVGGPYGVSENLQAARNIQSILLELWAGASRVGDYELQDESNWPSYGGPTLPIPQQYYGKIRADGSFKPIAIVEQNLFKNYGGYGVIQNTPDIQPDPTNSNHYRVWISNGANKFALQFTTDPNELNNQNFGQIPIVGTVDNSVIFHPLTDQTKQLNYGISTASISAASLRSMARFAAARTKSALAMSPDDRKTAWSNSIRSAYTRTHSAGDKRLLQSQFLLR